MASGLHRIPAGGHVPDRVNAVIETPMGCRVRYEYDLDLEAFRLVTCLTPGAAYPADYGFIPSTTSPDGEPIDVFVLTDEASFPGCLIECRPVAVLRLTVGDVPDDKILAVPTSDSTFGHIRDLPDVPADVATRIHAFFRANPLLSGTRREVGEWEDAAAARKTIFLAWEGFLH